MKKYRPYCSGYIVLYVLFVLCMSDACYTLYTSITGTGNQYMQSFSLFSYLIAALAAAYVYVYARTQICIDDKQIRIVFPAYIEPQGDKRAFFAFRQGNLDIKLIDKRFPLATVERYGYVDDLKFSRVDKSQATEKGPLFPVKEVCFLTSDGKRYHMNAGIYKKKQLKAMFTQIRDITGKAPEGSLKDILD